MKTRYEGNYVKHLFSYSLELCGYKNVVLLLLHLFTQLNNVFILKKTDT